MHTCRFCKTDLHGVRMVRYAARHWAHYGCWLNARGLEIADPHIYQGILQALEGLREWQLQGFPVFALSDWLKRYDVRCPKVAGRGSEWVNRACWLLRTAIKFQTKKVLK